MIYQPTPDHRLLSTDGICYTLRYGKAYTGPDNPQNDESHIHNCYEIYVNISGNISFLVDNRLYPIKKGDIIFTKPGDVHLCIYRSNCIHEHFCLWIDAPSSSPLVSFAYEPDFSPFIALEETARESFLKLLHRLSKAESESSSALTRTAVICQLFELLQGHRENALQKAEPQLPEEMQQILTYLNTHFYEIQYVKDIYDKFYVSPATLNRWFRKYIHISPRDFLESKKLAYARQLLGRGYSVTEAGIQSGFSDCSYFITVFKKKFGTTPMSYKRDTESSTLLW